MTGRSLRPERKEVEVLSKDSTLNNKDNNMLSKGDSIMSSEEIMLMQILFLAPEVAEEAEAKSAGHVSEDPFESEFDISVFPESRVLGVLKSRSMISRHG
jgi:hypothetical protein